MVCVDRSCYILLVYLFKVSLTQSSDMDLTFCYPLVSEIADFIFRFSLSRCQDYDLIFIICRYAIYILLSKLVLMIINNIRLDLLD